MYCTIRYSSNGYWLSDDHTLLISRLGHMGQCRLFDLLTDVMLIYEVIQVQQIFKGKTRFT